MFTVTTDHPIAHESFDHIYPCGTMYDNNTSFGFIIESENMFSKPIHMMDLGCSGGQLVADFAKRGHLAIGIEGSDFSIVHERANWPALHNVNLFTADITKPFEVKYDGEPFKCNIITAWEVIEHIEPEDLSKVFNNMLNHLKDDGFIVMSIGLSPAPWEGVDLHRSLFDHEGWKKVLSEYFDVSNINYRCNPREDSGGYFVKCCKKQ